MEYVLKITDSLGTRIVPLGIQRRWWEIGRSASCQVVVKGTHVSRKQCTLLHLPIGGNHAEPAWILQDGNLAGDASLNGTLLNQDPTPVHRKQIRVGDTIYLGSPDAYAVLACVEATAAYPIIQPPPSEDMTQPVMQGSQLRLA